MELATDVAAEGVATSVTPSGLEIYYQSKPKRLYRLRYPDHDEWTEVPSVTTVLDVFHKDALTWWGQGIGIDGVMKLLELELIRVGIKESTMESVFINEHLQPLNREGIIELMKLNKLTTSQVRDTAAARGVDVHDALEAWATTGLPPVPEKFDPEKRGYVRGLEAFLIDLGDAVEPMAQEVLVASYEHRFAGRYDLRIKLKEPRRVRVHITDSRQERYAKYATIPAGEGIIDLKTSKGVYDTHFFQVAGYELASVEDGYDASDWQAILHVTPDGYYQLKRSRATAEQFIAARHAWQARLDVQAAH